MRNISTTILFSLSWTFFTTPNCPGQVNKKEFSVPLRHLPAREILALEGIRSIHFFDSDSSFDYNRSDSAFRITFEYYLDSNHLKSIQYYLGLYAWNTSVTDLQKNQWWNYYSKKLTIKDSGDIHPAYEGTVQALFGSWLQPPVKFLRSEKVGDKLCDVFTDSTGLLEEWIWSEHRLPIQRKRVGGSDIFQITTTRKQIIEMNIEFDDSIFLPPK